MNYLFENKARVDLEYAFHNENDYYFYDRSAREESSKIREVLNNWFINYPVSEQNEMKSRFKKTFSSAFYELFIHELFRRQGFEVIVHPNVPNSSKKPDFLIRKGGFEFYLEAKVAKEKSHQEEAQENRINYLYDSINKIRSPNFFLDIKELLLKSKAQPSAQKLIKIIEGVLGKHDPDRVAEKMNNFGYGSAEQIFYEDKDLKTIISLIPKVSSARTSGGGRPIGAYPWESKWGGSEDAIKTSFSKKAKRYGVLDKPYLICINAPENLMYVEDVNNVLWGTPAWTWSSNPDNKDGKWERMKDGVFLGEGGPKYKNVCGLLVTKVVPHNIPISPYWFTKHPFSDKPSDFSLFNFGYYFVDKNKIHKKEGKTTGEILNIKPDWIKLDLNF